MKLGVLFSGGKDSNYALLKAKEEGEVVCLITVLSKNKESYMFHTPNIEITRLQAEAIGLPLVQAASEGVKEEELEDLKKAIKKAKKKFGLQGIVTGAVQSAYQSTRIQRICDELGLKCINPLWGKDQEQLIRELLEKGFRVMITGIFAYPLDERWLGRELDEKTLEELVKMRDNYRISIAGEGGEIETTILDAPFYKKKLEILDSKTKARGNSGVFTIRKARLAVK